MFLYNVTTMQWTQCPLIFLNKCFNLLFKENYFKTEFWLFCPVTFCPWLFSATFCPSMYFTGQRKTTCTPYKHISDRLQLNSFLYMCCICFLYLLVTTDWLLSPQVHQKPDIFLTRPNSITSWFLLNHTRVHMTATRYNKRTCRSDIHIFLIYHKYSINILIGFERMKQRL